MERTTRQSWLSHINAWKESGLSQAEFCRREGLRYPKFCYHCQQDRQYKKTKISVPVGGISKNSTKIVEKITVQDVAKNIFVPLFPSQLAEFSPVKVLRKEVEAHKVLTAKVLPKNSLIIDNIGSSTLGGKSGIKLQFPAFSIEIECNFCPQTLSAILTVLNVRC